MELLGIGEELIESLPDAVFVVSDDGQIVFVNAQAVELFGYTRGELVGLSIDELVPEEVRRVHPSHRDRYFRDAEVRPMGAGLDLSGRRKDGSQFPAEISLSALETREGRIVTAVVRDVTDRKKTQAKFEGLLEAAPDAMVGVDSAGTIRLVNTQAERLFGYPREELLGRRIETLVPEHVRDRHPEHRDGYFREPLVRPMGAGLDLSGRRKDGSEFPAEISLSSIDTEDGVLVTAAVRDVTERKAFEAVVARARDTAERAARARQEFLANMSHEIRTPMNAVIGMTSLLLDTELDDEQRDFVETVRASGDHLLTIINDILDYAKIDAGKLVLESLPFGLRDWLQESLDLITLSAHVKGLEVVCEVAHDVPDEVVGDPGRLRQVLVNLLSNAVKFTAHGEIVVSVTHEYSDGDAVQLGITVTDTGMGISADRIEALFDPFTQADSTTTRTYGGTGLGLAISRQLAEGMGGSIEMQSEPGRGTTVEFRFRVHATHRGERYLPEALRGRRLLFVDDNATNRRILGSWFRRAGMICVSASSAEEALDVLAHDEPFEFGILDLMMPVMDGAELGRLWRERSPGTHLVLLSSAGPQLRQMVARDTFDAVLSKPIRQDQLMNVMTRLVDPAAAAQESPPAQRVSPFELPHATHSISVLVVEDTPVNQKVAQHLLARFGIRADVAASGHEALRVLEQRSYDLVFMDVQMPEMDGLEATRIIRERWPERNQRIVAMTANVAPEDVRRCLDAGMDGFLGKPLVVEALAEVLSATSAGVARSPVHTDDEVDPEVLEGLAKAIGNDRLVQLVDMFLDDAHKVADALHSARLEEDRPALAAQAHKVKSAALSLGAMRLGELLDEVEHAAPAAAWPALAALAEQAEQLCRDIGPVLRASTAGF